MMRFVAKSIRRGWHDGEVILNSVHHRNCFICAWKQISPRHGINPAYFQRSERPMGWVNPKTP